MKRILSLIIIIMMLTTLVGCSISFGDRAAASNDAPTLTDAVKALDELYRGKNNFTSSASEPLVGSIKVGDTSFKIVWSTDNEKISVNLGADGNYTVAIVDSDDAPEAYTLVATVFNSSGDCEVYTVPAVTASENNNKPAPPTGGSDNTDPDSGTGGGNNNTDDPNGDQGGAGDVVEDPDDEQVELLSKVTEVKCGKPYYLASKDETGDLYFSGAVSGGLLQASGVDSATEVMLEAADGEGKYYIYFMSSGTKTYIGVNTGASTKSAGFTTATSPNSDFIWIINQVSQTIISESFTNRGIASRLDASDNVMRTYAANNFGASNYQTAWFVHASGTTGGTGGSTGDSTGGTTGGNTGSGTDDLINIGGTYSYTFTSKVFSGNETQKLGAVKWTLDGNGGWWAYENDRGQQFGSKNNPYDSMTLTSEAIAGVKKISITLSTGNGGVGTLFVYVNGQQIDQPVTFSSDSGVYVFDTPVGIDGEVTFELLQSTPRAIFIKTIEIVTE